MYFKSIKFCTLNFISNIFASVNWDLLIYSGHLARAFSVFQRKFKKKTAKIKANTIFLNKIVFWYWFGLKCLRGNIFFVQSNTQKNDVGFISLFTVISNYYYWWGFVFLYVIMSFICIGNDSRKRNYVLNCNFLKILIQLNWLKISHLNCFFFKIIMQHV